MKAFLTFLLASVSCLAGEPPGGGSWLRPEPTAAPPALLAGSSDPLALRFVRSLRGHRGQIWHLEFSPDGRFLATSDGSGKLILWRVPAFQPEWERVVDPAGLLSASFSPDGASLAVTGQSPVVRLISARTGEDEARLEGHRGAVWGAAFSADGKLLVTTSDDTTARVWDVPTRKLRHTFDWHRRPIHSPPLFMRREIPWVVTADAEPSLAHWNALTGEGAWLATSERLVQGISVLAGAPVDVPFPAHGGPGGGTAYLGPAFATGSYDRTARLWSEAMVESPVVYRGPHEDVNGLAFTPDARHLIGGIDDGDLFVWNVGSGEVVQHITAAHRGWIANLAVSPDGRWVATGGQDRLVKLWEPVPKAP